jgi:uncharacterized protein YbjT (DUF2867 family)
MKRLRAPADYAAVTLRHWLLVLLQPRQHVLCEARQVADRILLAEEAGVAHHQEVAHTAAVFAEAHDLVVRLIGRAAEQDTGIDQVLHAGAMHGAGNSRGRGGFLYTAAFHLLLGRIYDDKDVQERIVRTSKLDWVIVRPVILTNGPKTNAYRALVDPRGWTCGFISRADVADFLVKQVDDDAFLHKTPVLTSCPPFFEG